MAAFSNNVSVIIPVHNQRQLTLDCIESVLGTVDAHVAKIVVIDDASTDDVLRAGLRNLERDSRIQLIEHKSNLGFVRSVNEGMRLCVGEDVILLNSDTVVYGNWIERLQRAAYADNRIATSNPLTNFGGSHIGFYPKRDPGAALELTAAELDACARECNHGRLFYVHTTVGFCMYIKRAALNDIGYFDEENFRRAYGEEADFCYRANYAGWKHVIAGDVFVSHFHGKSFGEEKKVLMEKMLKTFGRLHPNFASLDAEFWSRDELGLARCSLDLKRLARYLEVAGGKLEFVLGDAHRVSSVPLASLDEATGVLSFLPPSDAHGFFDLPVFCLPRDFAFFFSTMRLLGVSRITFRNSDCNDAILALAVGEPFEINWLGSMPAVSESYELPQILP